MCLSVRAHFQAEMLELEVLSFKLETGASQRRGIPTRGAVFVWMHGSRGRELLLKEPVVMNAVGAN